MRELSAVLGELYARVPRGIKLGLNAMHAACTRFGNPERALAFVHVAGTNGKGSVCAMVESIARANGVVTGLYTSPHLARFAERIRVGGEPIADDVLCAVLDDVLRREPDLTFFEVATLAGLLAFREAKVELVVLEVGLGGRLDATNVVPSPRACAVTRIALDHQDKLGDTLPEIAREKAAIAKPGAPLVLGLMPEDILAEIEGVARARRAVPMRAAHDTGAVALATRTPLALAGAHQRDNALLACALAHVLGMGDDVITRGLAETRWPGRLETLVFDDGPVLFDAAHNPDGARALFAALAAETRPLALVFGALADKDGAGMLDILAPLTPHRVFVPPRGRAAMAPASLAARHAGATFETAAEAYAAARAAVGPAGLVVVAGSISLVGELRARLRAEKRDPPVAL